MITAEPCFYCSSASYEPHWQGVRDRLRYVPGEWSFLRCLGCGSAMLHPRPDPSQLASFYPPVYDLTPRDFREGSAFHRILSKFEYRWFFHPQYRTQARLIRKIIKTSGTTRLLDLGCGGGLRLLSFREAGFEVAGADFRKETVDFLKQNLGIPAFVLDVHQPGTTLPAESYDVVTAFHLLEHLAEVGPFLKAAVRLLKPGGRLIITIPMMGSLQARLFGSSWCAVTEAPRHLSIPSQEGIRRQLREAGFEEPRFYPDTLLNEVGTAVLSLFPAAGRRHQRGTVSVLPFMAAVLGLACLPLGWAGILLNRSAISLVAARKPKPGSRP